MSAHHTHHLVVGARAERRLFNLSNNSGWAHSSQKRDHNEIREKAEGREQSCREEESGGKRSEDCRGHKLNPLGDSLHLGRRPANQGQVGRDVLRFPGRPGAACGLSEDPPGERDAGLPPPALVHKGESWGCRQNYASWVRWERAPEQAPVSKERVCECRSEQPAGKTLRATSARTERRKEGADQEA